MEQKKMKQISTSIREDLLEKLKIYAIKNNKPYNFFLNKWIEELDDTVPYVES